MEAIAELIKVPELRFPEFSGEWEEKRLGGIFSFKNGMTISASQYGGDVAFINVSQILQSKAIKSSDAEKHVNIDSTSISDFLLQEGDFLFQRSSETREDVGSSNFFIGSGIAVYSGFVIRGRPKIMNAATFIAASLKQHKTRHSISRLSGGSTRYNIGQESLAGVHLRLPSLPEQQKIAEFLTAVDEKIGKLKRKKELLEAYKKGAMQKLFSQEIRFKDDHGNPYPDWEEKRLGEIGQTYAGLSGKSKEDFGSGVPYVQYMQVFSNTKIRLEDCDFVRVAANEKQNTVQVGDALFTTSSETPTDIGTCSVLTVSPPTPIYLNSFCFGYRLDIEANPAFLAYLFHSPGFREKMIPLAQGSTRFNLSKSNFLKLNTTFPSLPEQQKIAEFLTGIDDKINAVANQIDKAAEFKKGLLQKMFV